MYNKQFAIITSSIMKHATTHNILYPLQFGFRSGRSCDTQLTGFISDLFNSMHKSEQIDVLVLDMAKAFDKVGHRRLLKKLEYYGIRGPTNRWINSFLYLNGPKQSSLKDHHHIQPRSLRSSQVYLKDQS